MATVEEKVEEIIRRRMRLPPPKEKKPVTWKDFAAFVVPFLWALIYLVDQVVIFYHLPVSWLHELLFFLTALAFFSAFLFSPRDDVIPWEKISEPRQRGYFFVSCGCALAGMILLWLFGAGFWIFMNLALAVLTLFWLVLPFMVLSGLGALRLLLFSMRLGMIWWTSMFVLYVIRDGSAQIMNNNFPVVSLAFLGISYWWFLKSTNFLASDEAGEWPSFSSQWPSSYWLGLSLSGLLVLLWILTGFTNKGSGWYGVASYQLPFPFYDVAAFLEPLSFSNGNLLLLHAIPWKKLFFFYGTNELKMLSGLHGWGLACLLVAVFGAFASLYAGMKPRLMQLYAVLALGMSVIIALQTIIVWYRFGADPKNIKYCSPPQEGVSAWECGMGTLEGMDHFMLMGQHIPTLFFALTAIVLALYLLVLQKRRKKKDIKIKKHSQNIQT